MKIKTKSAEETKEAGKELALKLTPGDVLLLYGNLGAGKTTFTQGLAEGLGIKERILSPTFVLQRSHSLNLHNIKTFHHIDLYRIEGKSEIDSLGLSEILQDKEAVMLIEWAEKLKDYMPEKGYKILIDYLDDKTRSIEIDNF